MSIPVKVLIVDDAEADAELSVRELRKAGFDPEWRRVDNERDYITHLDTGPNLILSDYRLPRFDALRALRMMKERSLSIPLIVVAGTLGDETARELMERGASDIVLKRRMAPLGQVVMHAVNVKKLLEERRQALEALQKNEARLRELIESTSDILWEVDRNGVYTYCSPNIKSVLGYEVGEVIGRTPFDFMPPEETKRVSRLFGEAVARRQPIVLLDHEVVLKDGSRRVIECNGKPVLSEDGQLAGYRGIDRDITERKRAQEEANRHSQELEALLGIANIMAQPGLFEVKSKRILEELRRISQVEFVSLRTVDENQQGLRLVAAAGGLGLKSPPRPLVPYGEGVGGLAFQQGKPIVANDYQAYPYATPHLLKQGIRSFLSLPLRANGAALGIVNVVSLSPDHFTTERVKLLTAIGDGLGVILENFRLYEDITLRQELERRQNIFISVVSHELRTPLTSIMGFSELMLNKKLPETTRLDWLNRINRESRKIAALVDGLVDVSCIQCGKIAIKPELLPLRAVGEEVLTTYTSTTDHHQFTVDVPEDIPSVWADRDKLGQVLTNLVTNAIKYSPQGGRIGFIARPDPQGERVVVSVSDEGIGISPEDQEQLFTTFHRIHRPETAGVRGTGLGLYIVKTLVEMMHGRVWVESELNKGSTFSFSLPTKRVDAAEDGQA